MAGANNLKSYEQWFNRLQQLKKDRAQVITKCKELKKVTVLGYD